MCETPIVRPEIYLFDQLCKSKIYSQFEIVETSNVESLSLKMRSKAMYESQDVF